jgi:hypothetical protein
MGEASPNRRQILQAQPWCIYCGGVNKATTIDHMPPITIFDQRQRPSGLEFSACDPCNGNSDGRLAEKIVGLLSRMSPAPSTDAGREELERLFSEFARHHPDVLTEMQPTQDQVTKFERQQQANPAISGHPLNVSGPRLNNAMNLFAAKLALALHFKRTGNIASTSAVVASRWYSNYQVYTEGIPEDLLKTVGDPSTLVQGNWSVGEQFAYAVAHTTSGKQSLSMARFRKAFVVSGMVWDGREPPELEGFPIVRPGFLRPNSCG